MAVALRVPSVEALFDAWSPEPLERRPLGDEARQRILDHFTIEHCVEGYDRLYRTLLAGGRPRDVPQIRVSL